MRTPGRLLALAVVLGSSNASAAIVWRGDFEPGDLSQWGEKLNAHRISVVDAPVREGKKAGRFEIRQGDKALSNMLVRVELGHHPPGKMEGTEGYYAWSAMPSSDKPFVAGSHQITYWECDKIYKQVMSFHVDGEKISLATRIPTSKAIWNGTFTRGAWHDFILHVKWSPDPTLGFVELWYDGAKVVEKTMVATQHRDAGVALNNFIHQGIFRGADTISAVEVMYLDGTVAGTTLADVMRPDASDAGADSAADAGDGASDDAGDDASDDAAEDSGEPPSDAAVDVGPSDAGTPAAGSDDGSCACRSSGASPNGASFALLLVGAIFSRRRSRPAR